MGRQWPGSVVNAMRCLSALVVLMALGTVLTILLQDDLIEAWAEGNPGAREILREGGIEALKASSISLPAFVPVVVVMFVVLLGLLAVLRVFFREGYEWARVSLAAVGAAHRPGRRADRVPREPARRVRRRSASSRSLVDLAFLALLAHPDTTEFIRGSWLAHHEVPDSTSRSELRWFSRRLARSDAALDGLSAGRGTVLVVEHVFDRSGGGDLDPVPRRVVRGRGAGKVEREDASVRRPRGGPQGAAGRAPSSSCGGAGCGRCGRCSPTGWRPARGGSPPTRGR